MRISDHHLLRNPPSSYSDSAPKCSASAPSLSSLPSFHWAILFISLLISSLFAFTEAIILPKGAHMQSLSPAESAQLAMECGESTETMPQGRRHPWAVSIMTRGLNKLGGTIISPWHILTAAHGFLQFDNINSGVYGYRTFEVIQRGWTVVYGDDCIWHQEHDYVCAKPNLTRNRIRAIFVDDGFAEGECVRGHDWAIVELEERITFSSRVRPICLPFPRQQIPANEVLTVTSWGRKDALHKGDPLIREIPMRHDAECKDRPWMDFMPTKVEDYLCAKALNPKDYHSARTCHGDSGSGMEWNPLSTIFAVQPSQPPIGGTVTAPPTVAVVMPSPSVAVANNNIQQNFQPISKQPQNGTKIGQILTATMPTVGQILVPAATMPTTTPRKMKNRRRRVKATSRQVMRSPLVVPELEFMRKWPISRRKDEPPRQESNKPAKQEESAHLLSRMEKGGGSEQQRQKLIRRDTDGRRAELVGITSFGSRQCASDELARFTRIANYVEKICALTGVCYPLNGVQRGKR